MSDTIIIGGGHNGLVAAYYLAKAGRRPLVLERQPYVGGGAVTTEIHPGFRCPSLSHEILVDEKVVGDLNLKQNGVELIPLPALVCAPSSNGHALVLHDDVGASVAALRSVNRKDADAYAAFRASIERLSEVIGTTFDSPPPDIDAPTTSDLWNLLKAGRRFRALGKRDSYRLLRWLSMPVGDLMAEWFENAQLKAVLAGPGVSGTMLGPRSAGSSMVMLLREASRLRSGGTSMRARGGPGAVTQAMARAAREAGAEIRTGVTVERITVTDGRVTAVVANGQTISCATVLSGLDPRTTFLSLVDPAELAPEFTTKVRNYRASGTVAKVNLALASLPAFRGIADPTSLAGRIHIGPDLDYIERAFDCVKYGNVSSSPWLDITIPSIVDTELTPKGAHVASIYTHYSPFTLRATDWSMAKDVLLSNTLDALEAHAPGIRSLVVAADIVTPPELQARVGASGGHMFHGELSLDQLFTMRPLLGHANYGSPIRGLHLCGAGTHPGGFMTGTSGRLAARALLRQ
ncbi:MAG TPA: NAD(P)/FAD-dependent oxidoreductase [Vicinamibacterales bacterium]|nr:NAD(P)/FAD-dependent oxidoreductase [Vicinamibacterales bacterium]